MNGLAPETRRSQLSEMLDNLHSGLDDNLYRLNELMERLQPVLRSPYPQPTQPATEETQLVPAADYSRQAVYKSNRIGAMLTDILDRLEV